MTDESSGLPRIGEGSPTIEPSDHAANEYVRAYAASPQPTPSKASFVFKRGMKASTSTAAKRITSLSG